MTKDTIIYIGNFKLSVMDAQCQLVLGNCSILHDLGYRVVLIGNDPCFSTNDPLFSKQRVNDFDFYNIQFDRTIMGLMGIIKKGKQIVNIMESYDNIKMVICYGSPGFALQLYLLFNWCRKRGIRIIYNCADISSQAHGSSIERIAKRLDKRIKDHFIIYKADGLLTVSSYIRNYYYQKKSKPSAVIPPLKGEQKNNLVLKKDCDSLNLIYIGIPFPIDGRVVDEVAYKDRIDLFIDLLCSIRNQTRSFCFNIYGLTEEQYIRTVSRQKELIDINKDIITFHGIISHEKAIEELMKADYSVVYRSINQMTMAGFSSKLVESIWCGTPVIMTDTSDYKQYLEEGVSCNIIDYANIKNAREQLVKVLNKEQNVINSMKESCYYSNLFNYNNFTNEMKHFLNEVLQQ